MNGANSSKNVLNNDVEIKGTIRFAGELTFDGKLEGDIQSDGSLTVGENAVVNGNLAINSVVVKGKVNGSIVAKDKIDLKAKSELFGDIRAAKLVIEEGVTFVGKTEVNPNKATPSLPPGGQQRPVESGKAAEGGKGAPEGGKQATR